MSTRRINANQLCITKHNQNDTNTLEHLTKSEILSIFNSATTKSGLLHNVPTDIISELISYCHYPQYREIIPMYSHLFESKSINYALMTSQIGLGWVYPIHYLLQQIHDRIAGHDININPCIISNIKVNLVSYKYLSNITVQFKSSIDKHVRMICASILKETQKIAANTCKYCGCTNESDTDYDIYAQYVSEQKIVALTQCATDWERLNEIKLEIQCRDCMYKLAEKTGTKWVFDEEGDGIPPVSGLVDALRYKLEIEQMTKYVDDTFVEDDLENSFLAIV